MYIVYTPYKHTTQQYYYIQCVHVSIVCIYTAKSTYIPSTVVYLAKGTPVGVYELTHLLPYRQHTHTTKTLHNNITAYSVYVYL